MIRKMVLFAVSLLQFYTVRAQSKDTDVELPTNKVYVGIEGTFFANFTTFSGNSYVDNGMRKPPLLTRSFGLSLRQNVSKRLSLETGLSLVKLGYKAAFTGNYRSGKRWEDKSSVTAGFSQFSIPVRVNYFLGTKSPKLRKYLSLGTNIIYNPNAGFTGTVGSRGSFGDSYTGDSFTFNDRRYPSPRLTPTALVGIGVERNLGKNLIASLGIVYSQGFRNIAVWDTEYTTWDVSRDVDAVTFKNTIVNRGTYVGLRLAFQVVVF